MAPRVHATARPTLDRPTQRLALRMIILHLIAPHMIALDLMTDLPLALHERCPEHNG